MRLFHVVVVNDRTGRKDYMTQDPCTHSEACTILRKIGARRFPTRARLEPV